MADRIVTILTSGFMDSLGQCSRDKAERQFSLFAIMLRYERFLEEVVAV